MERLKRAREQAGYKSGSDAAEAFGWKVSTYLGHENGSRGLRAGVADRYARAFRVSPEWLLYGRGAMEAPARPSEPTVQVTLIGTIGQDQSGHVRPFPRGRPEYAEIPLATAGRWEAVLVEGAALEPAYRSGFLLIYRPVQHDLRDLIGHECVIETVDGRRFVRFLFAQEGRPGFWRLESDFDDDLENQEVRWASPVRFVQVWRTNPAGSPTGIEQG